MTSPVDPLAGVPAELHDLMSPFLNMAKELGAVRAEQIMTYKPLPWSDDEAAVIISNVIGELDAKVRAEMPTLPDLVTTAMCRQLMVSFGDRLNELYEASGSMPQGGSA